MRPFLVTVLSSLLLSIGVAFIGAAQQPAEWTERFPPFRIAGNLYYVGSKGLANYLISTPTCR